MYTGKLFLYTEVNSMKDIMARISKSEKEYLTYLRNMNVFKIKDLERDIQTLLTISSISNINTDLELLKEFLEHFTKIVEEKEQIALKKLDKKVNSKKADLQNEKPELLKNLNSPIMKKAYKSESKVDENELKEKLEVEDNVANVENKSKVNSDPLIEKFKLRNLTKFMDIKNNS